MLLIANNERFSMTTLTRPSAEVIDEELSRALDDESDPETVRRALLLKDASPTLFERVAAGGMTLSAAWAQLKRSARRGFGC